MTDAGVRRLTIALVLLRHRSYDAAIRRADTAYC